MSVAATGRSSRSAATAASARPLDSSHRDPRERRHPDDGPAAPDRACARGRGAPDRGRGGRARNGARLAGGRRPAQALRAAGLHGLAHALPHVVDGAARGAAGGLRSPDGFVDAMRAGQKLAAARGVTAIHDKDGWLGALNLFQRLEQNGSLSLRVWQSQPHERIGALRELGLRSGAGSPLLRLGYIKAFMDGTLGSKTAWMLDGSGVVITTGEELQEIIRRAAEIWFPVAVHAIGDMANRQALDAFEATRDVWEPLGLRQRIEHCQCVDRKDLPRFAQLGIACSG